MKTQHTPPPYRCQPMEDGDYQLIDESCRQLAVLPRRIAEGELEANAEFITRACNSYAEMLAALKDLTESAAHNLERTGYPHDQAMLTLAHIDTARAVIAKATEGQP